MEYKRKIEPIEQWYPYRIDPYLKDANPGWDIDESDFEIEEKFVFLSKKY